MPLNPKPARITPSRSNASGSDQIELGFDDAEALRHHADDLARPRIHRDVAPITERSPPKCRCQ